MSEVAPSVLEDVIALKVQQAEMRRAVDDGNRTTQNAIASLSGRLDGIADLVSTVTQLQMQHASQRDGLDRAFAEVEETDRMLASHIRDEDAWRKTHERENAAVDKKLTFWQGIALGISLTVGLATTAFAMWGGEVLSDVRGEVNSLRTEVEQLRGVR